MAGVCYLNQAKFEAAVSYLERARAATQDAEKVAYLDEMLAKVKTRVK
jgi:uncharacterized protein HemY